MIPAPELRRRDSQSGVSLFETLVVLAIIGIMAGVTVLGLGALDRGARAETEALRLRDRLELAGDEALVGGVPLALDWDTRGYRFLSWDMADEAWRASLRPGLGLRHDLPAGIDLVESNVAGTEAIMIGPDIPSPSASLRLSGRGGADWSVSFDGFNAVTHLVER